MDRKEIGQLGEEMALRYLRRQGYRILERNFRCRLGEIDLIAREKEELVFIEVKTRTSTRFGLPQEAVNWEKQRRLSRLAQFYLVSRGLAGINCRFDVVAILLTDGGKPRIEIIKDAFPLQGG
ncbi:MAG TPA: YraN family protein [Firmicutes bacterium]|jgi:putative endonuclease|nr:YraN family protein [Bacillota bacterium]